jgi:CTP:molybdopterin cytidylyltransferase MocA
VLAAGGSARLGACKALVPLAGSTPLALLLRAGASLDARSPLVVTGADDAAIRAAAPPEVEVALNARWRAGRTGGVALAAALRPACDLCLAPVDVPLVPARVFEALRAAWLAAGSPPRGWLAPAVHATQPEDPSRAVLRYGHPIVVGRALLGELATSSPARPLYALRSRADPIWSIRVFAGEILDDLDTPADLARLRARCSK